MLLDRNGETVDVTTVPAIHVACWVHRSQLRNSWSLWYLHLYSTVGMCICRIPLPRGFPDNCLSVLDPETCEYTVHKKDDPSVTCPIYGGKWWSHCFEWSIGLKECIKCFTVNWFCKCKKKTKLKFHCRSHVIIRIASLKQNFWRNFE